MVSAVYRLPAIRHLILVISHSSNWNGSSTPSIRSKKRREDLEHILLGKDRMPPIKSQQWKVKLIHEDDFLMSLESLQSKLLESTNQPFRSPENMELLAINLVQTPRSSPETLSSITPKVLSRIPDEDIIEVFV
jgi:hypothetical protein